MVIATHSAPLCRVVASADQPLAFEADELKRKFGREPFRVTHALADHPLFELDRLVSLCQTLDADDVEYNAGEIPVGLEDHSLTPRNGLSPDETIRRISECKSWLVLKYVENDPEYRALLEQCLANVRPVTELVAPGMTKPHAFIFITSPGSVTPYHIDPEHNFLLQVRGEKHVTMFDGRDRELLTEENLEHFYSDRGRNLPYDPAWDEGAWKNTLQPGEGLHFPVTYPHYVRNGEEVSISFSITFRTPDLDRRQAMYQINDRLRRRGKTPPAVGEKPWRDSLLFQRYRVMRRLGIDS